MMPQRPAAISVILLISCFLFSCTSASDRNAEKLRRSRQLAKAAQEMAYSAELGSQGMMDAQFTMREPNPNKYVGSLLFERYCQSCHGKGKGPNILNGRVTPSDAESDYYIISYGLTTMPSFRRRLTKFQIFDILAYMNTDFTDFKLMHSAPPPSKKRPNRDAKPHNPAPSDTQKSGESSQENP